MPAVPKPQRKVNQALLDQVRALPCAACGAAAPSDPSHLISRGAGGPDQAWNVAPHCRRCHTEWHQGGPIKFLRKHPRFKTWLEEHGWEVDSNGAASFDMRGR